MGFAKITFEKKQGVGVITLNDGTGYNVLGLQMINEIGEALKGVGDDKEVRSLIITASGKAFSAGGDVNEMSGFPPEAMEETVYSVMGQYHQTLKTLVALDQPVIMAINGAAVGAGCNFALLGDLVVAADTAKFSQIFVRVAVSPDTGGYYALPRIVGLRKAKELMLFGDMLSAHEAEQLGLVNKVVPAGELEGAAWEWALRLAQGPTKTFGLIKRSLENSLNNSFEAVLEMEKAAQVLAFKTDDLKEGITAFLEKRKPEFKGR